MKEDYQGEESIPEIDSSEHPLSENNEETVNPKEPEEENEEPKKKSLREEDFFEISGPKKSEQKAEIEDFVWHTKEISAEGNEVPEEIAVEEEKETKEANEKSELESYEIKIKNYDEEKKKKKQIKAVEEAEEKKNKEEKKPFDRFMLLDFLFSFLEKQDELNVTLAGYFTKVFLSFFNKKPKEVDFVEFFVIK